MASPRRVAVAVVCFLPAPASTAGQPRAPSQSEPVQPTFLVVSSRKKRHLHVFPKGGVEHGESPAEAAEREAWEESGLRIGTATHLAHLLTLKDPSPHILSPSTDPTSPSFVASCEYSFELFFLPPPPPSSTSPASPPPSAEAHTTAPPVPPVASLGAALDSLAPSAPSTSATASSAQSSTSTSLAPSPASHSPPAPLSPLAAALSPAYTATYLDPAWPEAGERSRAWVEGWGELERAVAWGRREGVMHEAVGTAREWVERWVARGAPLGGDVAGDDEEDAEEEADGERSEVKAGDAEGAKGRI
ncbi:uncharacterized protein JCM10292_002219 [Rhodotorula paludigena]|uniref:uncharacterized protein n=1 Tax=Rhodotorula paludigena TaxID=86838 RepID=UPI003175259D